MYRQGMIAKPQLDLAVTLGWITQAQEDEIIAAGGDVGVLAVGQIYLTGQ